MSTDNAGGSGARGKPDGGVRTGVAGDGGEGNLSSVPDEEVEGGSEIRELCRRDRLSTGGVGGERSREEIRANAPGEQDGTKKLRNGIGGETVIYESNPSPWGKKDR